MTPARLAVVTAEPLDAAGLEAAVTRADAGAHVLFRGIVRDHDHGRVVSHLEYEAHPGAQNVLAAVVSEFAALDGVLGVAAAHRIGALRIGEVALVAVVSSAHRQDAFAHCARLVDEIKLQLPVWKRQVFADGTDEWVNCP